MQTMSELLQDVSIIGAGLGGCALALALSQQNISITIYESRPEISSVIPSGVVLTPNGLKILDHLGVFDRIKGRCYVPTHRVFKNDNDETTKKTQVEEPDGFRNHRIWRSTLLDEMKAMLEERSVRIVYNSKFDGIVSDSEEGVAFRINSEIVRASLLIGSDGIYSTLRQYIAPGIVPEYTGLVGVLTHIRRDSVAWPYPDYEKNATIQSKPGAMFWIAEDPEGVELMVGKQVKYPEQSREDLDRLQADKGKLAEFYLQDYDEYGATAKKIIDSVCQRKEDLFIWPFMKMPEIPQWYSKTGRVILVGDGAHALPPSSGQGVNQALEDVYSLSLMLAEIARLSHQSDSKQKLLIDGLSHWQQLRQKRLDLVFEWTKSTTNVTRLPEEDRKKLIAEGKFKEGQGDDMTWLYTPEYEKKIEAWSKAQTG